MQSNGILERGFGMEEEKKEVLIKAMEAAGYTYDYIGSSDDNVIFNAAGLSAARFDDWEEVDEWLSGVVFDYPEVSDRVEAILMLGDTGIEKGDVIIDKDQERYFVREAEPDSLKLTPISIRTRKECGALDFSEAPAVLWFLSRSEPKVERKMAGALLEDPGLIHLTNGDRIFVHESVDGKLTEFILYGRMPDGKYEERTYGTLDCRFGETTAGEVIDQVFGSDGIEIQNKPDYVNFMWMEKLDEPVVIEKDLVISGIHTTGKGSINGTEFSFDWNRILDRVTFFAATDEANKKIEKNSRLITESIRKRARRAYAQTNRLSIQRARI